MTVYISWGAVFGYIGGVLTGFFIGVLVTRRYWMTYFRHSAASGGHG